MPEYLATGRNPAGKKVTERLDVPSADEALRVLRERGYEEIVLHTDDFGARYTKHSAVASAISPRQYLWFRDLPKPLAGFLVVALNGYRQGWYWYVAALALLAYRRSQGMPWRGFDIFLALYMAFPALFALGAQFFRGAAGRYNRLIEAAAWGRWEEVLATADQVGGKVPREEVAFRKAGALAGLGRLDEALRLVKPFGDGRAMPPENYWTRVAGVYSTAKRLDDSKACMEKALGLAPDNATILIDIADSEVWLRRNPRRARELLARAREHALSDILQVFVGKVEGLIELEEGRPREARQLLEQTLGKLEGFRHASPLMGMMIDKVHAALALACAAEGDHDAALKHFRAARPRLVALRLDDQLARCEQALGLPAGG